MSRTTSPLLRVYTISLVASIMFNTDKIMYYVILIGHYVTKQYIHIKHTANINIQLNRANLKYDNYTRNLIIVLSIVTYICILTHLNL